MMQYKLKLEYVDSYFSSKENKITYNREFILDTIDLKDNILILSSQEFNAVHDSKEIILNDNLYIIDRMTLNYNTKSGYKKFITKIRHFDHEEDPLPF